MFIAPLTKGESYPFDMHELPAPVGEFLKFDLGEYAKTESTAYNPSIPFYDVYNGARRRLIMARHESLYSETDSEVVICDFDSKKAIEEAPVFTHSQDPYFLGKFRDSNDEFWQVIGMVRITVDKDNKITNWHDVFYRYKDSIMELKKNGKVVEPWCVGTAKWKDTRLKQFDDGIDVTPRPQGDSFGGAGMVGHFKTKNLDTLPTDLERFAANQDSSTLINGLFVEGHWGSVNQILGRSGSVVHALGHDACFGPDGLKNYASTYFKFDTVTKHIIDKVLIIATANQYPTVKPKPGLDLGPIAFTSGIVACDDGTKDYWTLNGIGDREIGLRRISSFHILNPKLQSKQDNDFQIAS